MCDQQILRSACAHALSDQSLRLSLEYSMTVKLLTEHPLEFLSLKGGYTGSFESTLVKMSHCWESRHSLYLPWNTVKHLIVEASKIGEFKILTYWRSLILMVYHFNFL